MMRTIISWSEIIDMVISIMKILIIDDDEDINNLFKGYLERNGFKVDAYTDPLNALCH